MVTGCWLVAPPGIDSSSLQPHLGQEAAAKAWVYESIHRLLQYSVSTYGADLGPEPADVALAVHTRLGPTCKS